MTGDVMSTQKGSPGMAAAPPEPTSRAQQVLDERARRLAAPSTAEQPARETVDVLTFAVAREQYAIETCYVREVVRPMEFIAVPRTPAILFGVCAIRGELLPVFDLRPLFNLSSGGLTDPSRVIVLGTHRAELGILADDVFHVTSLDAREFSMKPEHKPTVDRSYSRGVTPDALVVLDGRKLLEEQALFLD